MTTDPKPARELRIRFAANLREQRQKLGLSQEALADLAGLHRTYVSQVERTVTNVSIDNVEKLARALGVEADKLFSRREDVATPRKETAKPTRAQVTSPIQKASRKVRNTR